MDAAMEDIKPSPASTDSDMGLGYKRSGESLLSSSSKRSAHDMYKVIEVPRLPTDLDLPPLPVIANKAVEMRVFTHSTMAPGNKSGVKYAEEEEDLQDNEKLEWVGDGLLKSICTRLLQRLWPNMREGPTTTIMGHLVSNVTLAQISQRYDLMKRLRVPAQVAMSIKSSEKSQANLLEAYMAGVFESYLGGSSTTESATDENQRTEGQAYDHLSVWLVPLFEPVARFLQEHILSEHQRLSKRSQLDYGGDDIDPALAVGSSARLNDWSIRRGLGMPLYESVQTEGLLWKTKCTVRIGIDDYKSAETIQGGKKPGMTVAAYKLLVALKLEERVV